MFDFAPVILILKWFPIISFFDNGFWTNPILFNEYFLSVILSVDCDLFMEQTYCSVVAAASFRPSAFNLKPCFLKTSFNA